VSNVAELGLRIAVVVVIAVALLLGRRLVNAWQAGRRRRGLRSAFLPDLTQGSPTVLLFTGTLCGDCVMQKEILLEMRSALGNGWQLREVQAAQEGGFARRFGIESVPSTVVIKPEGATVAINYGLVPAETLTGQLKPLLKSA
jgi:thioredoxin-like negative regulator of GroEL